MSSVMEEETRKEKNAKPPSSYFSSLMNHIKCTVGSGIYALGFAFRKAGLAIGPPVLIFCGLVILHCQHLLVDAARAIAEKGDGKFVPDYGETAEGACLMGVEKRKKFAPLMKKLCNTILLITQFSLCTVYILFFAESVKYVTDHYVCLKVQWYILMGFVPNWILSSLLLNLKILGILSTLANFLTLIGILTTVYMTTTGPKEDIIWVGNLIEFPTFITTGMFTFGSIMIVLPIYIEIKNKAFVWASWGVLNVATSIEVALSVLVGCTSFIKYGAKSKGSVTLNFDINDKLAQTVIILVGISMLLSYALNMYVFMEVIFPMVNNTWGPFKRPSLMMFLIRTITIIFTCILAGCIPYLGTVIGLVGAFCNTSLVIILPTTINMLAFYHEHTILKKFKRFTTLVFGFCVLISGIISAVREIYNEFAKNHTGGAVGKCIPKHKIVTITNTETVMNTIFSNLSSRVSTVPLT